MRADILINNISQLITLKGPNRPRVKEEMNEIGIIENGVLAVSNDKIIYVGDKLPDSIIVDEKTIILSGKGKTVTPGLIDPHTHLVHGGSRENELSMKLKGMKYLDILKAGGGILSTVKSTRESSFEDLYNKAVDSLNKMLEFGVTTIEAKSGYGLDIETEIKQLKVMKKLNEDHYMDIIPTFLGAHAIPEEYKNNPDDFVDIILNNMIPRVSEENLAEFCDVFCEEGVFTVEQSKKILLKAKEYNMESKIHADEIVPLGGAELAAEIGAISADHLVAISEEGITLMAKNKVIADLLPGTSFNLGHKYAEARKMIEHGVPVALSTDYNPGSCPTENMQLIMTLASLKMKMTPEEVITAVTINAACSLLKQDTIGTLEVGKKADIAIFNAPNLDYIIYHYGINHIDTVIKNGKIVVRNSKII